MTHYLTSVKINSYTYKAYYVRLYNRLRKKVEKKVEIHTVSRFSKNTLLNLKPSLESTGLNNFRIVQYQCFEVSLFLFNFKNININF